jgi:hypothetical protein
MAVEPPNETESPSCLSSPPLLPRHRRIPVDPELEIGTPENIDERGNSKVLADSTASIFESSTTNKSFRVKEKVYGAPRVFDLFTLLAITLAFALLFALLGLLAPALDMSARGLTVVIGSYITLVGAAQMWLFGAKNPRAASLVGGPIAMVIVCFFPLTLNQPVLFAFVFSVGIGLTAGPFTGYIAGAVVAGVFLIADKIRVSTKSAGRISRDASFDEVQ